MWNRFRTSLNLARELSLADWLALVESWWVLTYYHFALRWVSLKRLMQPDLKTSNISECLSSARRLHRLVGWAARLHLLSMTCLVQSLALRWMLRRRGIASQLKIGATKISGSFHAHAWLEMDGEKVGESEDAIGIFRVLTRGTSPPTS